VTSTHLELALNAHQRELLGSTMPEALDAAASAWPDRLALREIEGQQRALTWSELHGSVEALRSGLEAAGVTAGDKVGVMLTNVVEFPIAWLAIVGAGATIVPLNPKYTGREIEFVLSDAGATWLIAANDLVSQHAIGGRVGPVPVENVVSVGHSDVAGHDYAALLRAERRPRAAALDPLTVANIQFTSGTTGLPKGCLLTHQYWVELGIYGAALDQESVRLLADHPFYYMQNQAYLMVAMFKGGALYITPGLSRRKFMAWLHEFAIDFAWIDEDLLEHPESPLDSALALKRAPVAGMPGWAYKPIEERFGIKARECYASTEVGSGTAVPYDRDDLAGNGSMGFCFPNRESKVIDEHGEEVGPGVAGELCMRGSGMMLGYHERPEANAELMLAGGWFRTGDIVTKSADGQHFYVGRVRDMIRRSGENISAAEVEAYIGSLEGVAEVAAVPVPDPDREEEVKVIVVADDGAELTAQHIVDWARSGLAAFKVPRYVEFRSELPYTPSGKIHKAALKAEADPLAGAVVDTKL